MATTLFAATRQKPAMDQLSQAKATSAMSWRRWLPLQALGGWQFRDLNGDLIAGLTLAAIAIPEQMATARLGGFAPEIGFFAFVAGSVAFALFGANRHLSAGADSTITPLFAGSLALLATSGSPHYLSLAAMLALMVGLIVTLSGIFRLGWIADLLSVPVTTGFLAGIAVHIIVSQMPGLLGLPAQSGETLRRVGEIAGSPSHQSLEPWARPWRVRDRVLLGADQRPHPRRLDRHGACHACGRRFRPQGSRRRGARRPAKRPAPAGSAACQP